MPDKKCILLFTKSPEKGTVKSRLARDVSEAMACSLYKHFVLDMLEALRSSRYPVKICYYPPNALSAFSAWLGSGYSYMPQKGNDLGERMMNAFREAFSGGFSPVVLVGSDVPDLALTVVEEGLNLGRHDAVIGPSRDGGYYLIGFRSDTFLPAIFEDMPWGTDRVFSMTMELFRKKHYAVHTLPEKTDIDRIEDLLTFAETASDAGSGGAGTREFIRNNFKALFANAVKRGSMR